MKVIMAEGSPEEIMKVFPHFMAGSVPADEGVADSKPSVAHALDKIGADSPEDEPPPVSVEIARKVLNRIPLSKEQRLVLRTLYDAHPKAVRAATLMSELNYTRPQFTGLMGAFGRRISHTSGYIDGTWLFEQDWDADAGSNVYGLPETVRDAMRLEKLA